MHPTHNPEFRDAVPPASLDRLDGRATHTITRQEDRLVEEVGRIDQVRIPGENTPLYGYKFEIPNSRAGVTEIDLTIAVDPITGELVDPADREFVEARNRVAVLRSRERSRGSRAFNFAFRKNRGDGPGGHGYEIEQAETEYHDQLYDFIARKVHSHRSLNNAQRVTEAVSRSVIQEQRQMSALENMAAEQKSTNRFLNFFRNHKRLRIAAGLALTGIAAAGVATGQLEVAIPAIAARTALSATGGYVLGRTIWDAVQGRRAENLPEEDPRMAGRRDGDFSGRLSPEAAFRRLIKLHGAEARAGSHNQRRQELINRMSAGLVHEYYTNRLNFRPNQDVNRIRGQLRELYGRPNIGIRDLQEERLKSDQTQSRRRHIAGIAGGVALAALPAVRLAGFIDLGHVGGSHGVEGHIAHSGHKGSSVSTAELAAHHSGTNSSSPSSGSGENGSGDVYINENGSGKNIFFLGMTHEPYGHYYPFEHGEAAGVHTEIFKGIPLGELHVKPGGGFISTLQEQYHLSPVQADETYDAMYSSLHGAPGTYLDGNDICISDPGDFKLPDAARSILVEKLKEMHKLPEEFRSSNGYGINAAEMEAKTGGTRVPNNTVILNEQGRITGLDHTVLNGNLPNDTLYINGGPDHITEILVPNGESPQGQALQAMVKGSYIPEVGLHGLTSEEIAHAQSYIMDLVHHHEEFTRLSPSAKTAIEIYTKASIDSPGPTPAAHEAADNIRNLLTTSHNNFNNLTPEQMETLEKNLAEINT